MATRKNPAAVQLGRKGGRASARSRASSLTDYDRAAIGKRLAEARWEKWREEHPEKARASEARRTKRAKKAPSKKRGS